VTTAVSPRFSIIIATYNWSQALRLALETVAAQTLTDFEVLVVGDACNDDSEDVVRSFCDERFQWHNLAENCGSQWGPNNYGLSIARGQFIAYLGHDDLWWPTHLENASRTFDQTQADVVAGATLLYGPKESGIFAVTGFFPNDSFTPRYFFPPSSLLHRHGLAEKIGGWRSPEQVSTPIDHDFIRRLHQSGAVFASTNEFTVFKFNAAWRRNAYQLRHTDEQVQFLEQARRSGDTFRQAELSRALRASVEDRLLKVEIPPEQQFQIVESSRATHRFKGSRKGDRPNTGIMVNGRLRFMMDDDYAGFEWHGLEESAAHGSFRWSGPATRSTIVAPIALDAPKEIFVRVIHCLSIETLNTARMFVNDIEVRARVERCQDLTFQLCGHIEPEQLPGDDRDEIRITLQVDRTCRPLDAEINSDRRWLGLAVSWAEISDCEDDRQATDSIGTSP
jgi:glycosyltransferase involved in cell wall biosynthesis